MARKSAKQPEHEEIEVDDEPPTINPYEVLGVEKEATADQVKSAYRRQALKHHPDKAQDKEQAHVKFQEIALAYAVLSDERRRKRYDITGRTDESLNVDDEDFDWTTYYREQYEDAISVEKIEAFAKEYKNSDDEAQDVLAAYEQTEGDMTALYEYVMLSAPEEDDDRFRAVIDAAIEKGEVEAYSKYTKETAKARKRRLGAARKTASKEAEEAEEMAVEVGLKKKGKKGDSDMSDLAALIQKRQNDRAGRAGSFFDGLEEKYAGKGTKRSIDGPSEEAFAKNRAKKSKASR